MSVHEDYRDRRLDRYFTSNFVGRHLNFDPVPIGGHQQYRSRARSGNVKLNLRHRDGENVARSSVIFDFDSSSKVRQIFRLMQEVEDRNTGGVFRRNGGLPLVTGDEYYINTTALGSRQRFVLRRFRYGAIPVDGRYIINHYDGDVRD